MILIVGFSFLAEITISVPFLYIIAIIVGTIASFIYKVIFISNIRLDNFENPPVIEKNKRKLLLKSWLLFRNELVAAFFAGLGLICFIWPGIVLLKRYQYVILITEDLELGPIEALRLSRKLKSLTKNESKILLQIHDELIFEVPEKEAKNMTKIIKN